MRVLREEGMDALPVMSWIEIPESQDTKTALAVLVLTLPALEMIRLRRVLSHTHAIDIVRCQPTLRCGVLLLGIELVLAASDVDGVMHLLMQHLTTAEFGTVHRLPDAH